MPEIKKVITEYEIQINENRIAEALASLDKLKIAEQQLFELKKRLAKADVTDTKQTSETILKVHEEANKKQLELDKQLEAQQKRIRDRQVQEELGANKKITESKKTESNTQKTIFSDLIEAQRKKVDEFRTFEIKSIEERVSRTKEFQALEQKDFSEKLEEKTGLLTGFFTRLSQSSNSVLSLIGEKGLSIVSTLGGPIGLLIGAFTALIALPIKAFFQNTAEGADLLTKASSGAEIALGRLNTSLGLIGSGLINLDFSKIKEGFSLLRTLGNAFEEGLEIGELKNQLENIARLAKGEISDLNREQIRAKEILNEAESTTAEKRKALEVLQKSLNQESRVSIDLEIRKLELIERSVQSQIEGSTNVGKARKELLEVETKISKLEASGSNRESTAIALNDLYARQKELQQGINRELEIADSKVNNLTNAQINNLNITAAQKDQIIEQRNAVNDAYADASNRQRDLEKERKKYLRNLDEDIKRPTVKEIELLPFISPNFNFTGTNIEQALVNDLRFAEVRRRLEQGLNFGELQIEVGKLGENVRIAVVKDIIEQGDFTTDEIKNIAETYKVSLSKVFDDESFDPQGSLGKFDFIKKKNPLLSSLLKKIVGEDVDPQITKKINDNLQSFANNFANAAESFFQGRINGLTNYIDEIQKRVDQLKEIAENGNAEQLEIEQKRLDELTNKRAKYIQQQQQLATLEIFTSQAVTAASAIEGLAKSFAQGGPLGIALGISYSLALAGAILGIGSAIDSAFSNIQGFKTGTDYLEGEGDGKSDSIVVRASKGERIVDADTNRQIEAVAGRRIKNTEIPELIAKGLSSDHTTLINTTIQDYTPILKQLKKIEDKLTSIGIFIDFDDEGMRTREQKISEQEAKRKRMYS